MTCLARSKVLASIIVVRSVKRLTTLRTQRLGQLGHLPLLIFLKQEWWGFSYRTGGSSRVSRRNDFSWTHGWKMVRVPGWLRNTISVSSLRVQVLFTSVDYSEWLFGGYTYTFEHLMRNAHALYIYYWKLKNLQILIINNLNYTNINIRLTFMASTWLFCVINWKFHWISNSITSCCNATIMCNCHQSIWLVLLLQ